MSDGSLDADCLLVIRDQIVNILLAGRDTTAGTLSFLFKELSAQPAIYSKLRQEILEKVGAQRQPNYEDLKDMPYLQHCINETLRMYPAVPYNMRVALKETSLPRGGGSDGHSAIGVLKDTIIGYSPMYLHRESAQYPAESTSFPPVMQFSPERWERWTPRPWQYIPFNGGPRICIGVNDPFHLEYAVVKKLILRCSNNLRSQRLDIQR